LLARSIVALKAPLSLSHGLLDGHERDIALPVTILRATIAVMSPVVLLRVGLSCFGGPQSWLSKDCGHGLHHIFLDVVSELGEALARATAATTSAA